MEQQLSSLQQRQRGAARSHALTCFASSIPSHAHAAHTCIKFLFFSPFFHLALIASFKCNQFFRSSSLLHAQIKFTFASSRCSRAHTRAREHAKAAVTLASIVNLQGYRDHDRGVMIAITIACARIERTDWLLKGRRQADARREGHREAAAIILTCPRVVAMHMQMNETCESTA